MEVQYSFKRYEKKYMLTEEQYGRLLPRLKERMTAEIYGLHTICNIYYDTPRFDLIRASVQKPIYKEKFRLRSYGVPGDGDDIFAEIKKKYKGVVYKRRVAAPGSKMEAFLTEGEPLEGDLQIQQEIRWFFQCYDLAPRVFIGYEREAYFGIEEEDLRITFDRNIRWRDEALTLQEGDEGSLLLPEGRVLMEVKVANSVPLWLAGYFSEYGMYSRSFSKYGTCYQENLANWVERAG